MMIKRRVCVFNRLLDETSDSGSDVRLGDETVDFHTDDEDAIISSPRFCNAVDHASKCFLLTL